MKATNDGCCVSIPTRLRWQSQKLEDYSYFCQRRQEAWRRIKRIWGIPLSILLLTPLLLLLEGVAALGSNLEDIEYRLMAWVLKRRSTSA